jgi:hypothetical protein
MTNKTSTNIGVSIPAFGVALGERKTHSATRGEVGGPGRKVAPARRGVDRASQREPQASAIR